MVSDDAKMEIEYTTKSAIREIPSMTWKNIKNANNKFFNFIRDKLEQFAELFLSNSQN